MTATLNYNKIELELFFKLENQKHKHPNMYNYINSNVMNI